MNVRQVTYHTEEWEALGGRWIIECDNCRSYGDEFLRGYAAEAQAMTAALKHRCDPRAVTQVERGEA